MTGQRIECHAHRLLKALERLSNTPLTRPQKRRRVETEVSDSDGSPQSGTSSSQASPALGDTSPSPIYSAVLQMAMQGIKPAALKLRRVRTVSAEDFPI